MIGRRKFLGVIPARGGSKGIPGKNLVEVGGLSLLARAVLAASKADLLDDYVVSTDDDYIKEAAEASGARVVSRPPALSTDRSAVVSAIRHVLEHEHEIQDFAGVVLLQPTSPLRTERHIDDCIALFEKEQADSVVSVVKVPHQFCAENQMAIGDRGLLCSEVPFDRQVTRRQDKPRLFARNGPAVLVTRIPLIFSGLLFGNRCFGYEMNPEDSIDVDSAEDLELAEKTLLSKHNRPRPAQY